MPASKQRTVSGAEDDHTVTLPVGIVGGGIAGMTLAAALQPRGIDVIVLEREAALRDTGAGISLFPNALAALDAIGLGEMVRSIGVPLASGGVRRCDGQSAWTFSRPRFEAALGEGLVCVDRGELVRALSVRLAPGTVRTGCVVSGYESGQARVTVRVADDADLAVAAVVGADGINSVIARQTKGDLRTSYSGYTAWRGIAETGPGVDEVWACLAGGREVGWMPVGQDRTYWFATAWLPQGHASSDGDRAYLERTLADWPEPIVDLLAATPPDRLVRNDIVDRDMPSRWSDGAVTVMGDAAHPMRPHLGQGGCQAIEDAAVLAGCLSETGDPASAFARYERRRRSRARLVVRLSRTSRLTRPADALASRAFDRLMDTSPAIPIGAFLRMIAPVAGYRAGQRAVRSA